MTASTTAKKPASRSGNPAKRAAEAAEAAVDEAVEATVPTPSELADAKIERDELRKELLADMPALRPAYRFRLRHRNDFANLSLEAIKSGAFDRDNMDYDLSVPKDIEDFQKLQEFVATIDEWAESIAEDPAEYDEWSQRVVAEGRGEETFMALFTTYQADLGESRGSAS
jgi:hypothetical protein